MDQMFGLLCSLVIPVVFVGLIVLQLVYSAKRREQMTAEWTAFAQNHGLTLSGHWPAFSLEGTFDGVRVWVMHDVHVGNKGQRHYTAHAGAEPIPGIADLSVQRTGLIERVFGAEDIRTGDVDFDKRFTVRCLQPGIAERFLDPEARRLLREFPHTYVADGAVRWQEMGYFINTQAVERALSALVRLARRS